MTIKELFAPSDMTVGKPWEKIVAFTIPMLIGNIAQTDIFVTSFVWGSEFKKRKKRRFNPLFIRERNATSFCVLVCDSIFRHNAHRPVGCRCFVFYNQYKAPQTHLQPMLQVIFTFCIGIINKYYNAKSSNINKNSVCCS